MSPASLPSNVFYGQLNRRFDRRAKLLRKLGYKYSSVQVLGDTIAVFAKPRRFGMRHDIITASIVLTSHNRIFRDYISRNR